MRVCVVPPPPEDGRLEGLREGRRISIKAEGGGRHKKALIQQHETEEKEALQVPSLPPIYLSVSSSSSLHASMKPK